MYRLRWTDLAGRFAIEIDSTSLQIASRMNSPPFPRNNLAFSIEDTTSSTWARISSDSSRKCVEDAARWTSYSSLNIFMYSPAFSNFRSFEESVFKKTLSFISPFILCNSLLPHAPTRISEIPYKAPCRIST